MPTPNGKMIAKLNRNDKVGYKTQAKFAGWSPVQGAPPAKAGPASEAKPVAGPVRPKYKKRKR